MFQRPSVGPITLVQIDDNSPPTQPPKKHLRFVQRWLTDNMCGPPDFGFVFQPPLSWDFVVSEWCSTLAVKGLTAPSIVLCHTTAFLFLGRFPGWVVRSGSLLSSLLVYSPLVRSSVLLGEISLESDKKKIGGDIFLIFSQWNHFFSKF